MQARTVSSFEYQFHCSPRFLFPYLSTPYGLTEWMAMKVGVVRDVYTFEWEDEVRKARLVELKPQHLARFAWMDRGEEEFLSFEIQQFEMSDDLTLVIKDTSDAGDEGELEMLWDNAIGQLRGLIGA